MSINKYNFDLLCSCCKKKIKKMQHKNNYKLDDNEIECKNKIYNSCSSLSTYDRMMKDINELTMKEWLDNWWTCIH